MKNALVNLWGAMQEVMFGYDATVDKGRRGKPAITTMSEDEQLNAWDRQKAIATQRDQTRNLPWVAWMARTHINWVSSFAFRATSENEDWNKKFDELMAEWSLPENCDVTKRHSLSEMMALFESGQVIDGDSAFMKVGTALQGIESDRIRKPNSANRDVKIPKNLSEHGLLLRRDGSVKSYAVCERLQGGNFQLQRMVPARNMFFTGYFKRFDQTRGISPLLTALNTNQDLYESYEYTLIKMKMHSMLGMAITREMPSSSDGWTYDTDNNTTEGGNSRTEYEVAFRAGTKLEMDPGDKVDMLESKTPSSEFQDFTQLMTRITLLALDIPFSFFDSDRSNNNAMRVEIRQYMENSRKKQAKNRRVLNDITKWKLQQWLVEGKITLDEFNQAEWLWQPSGIPIIDPQREIAAFAQEISNGFNSRTNIARERGMDQRQIFRDLKKEEDMIEELELKGITIGMPGQETVGEKEPGNSSENSGSDDTETSQQSAKVDYVEGAFYSDDETGDLYQYLNGKLEKCC
jgi:capsid protein